MMTRAQGRKQRRELMKQIAREHRQQAREKLRRLKGEIREAREARRLAIRQARERCRVERLAVRQRIKERRAHLLVELRELNRQERQAAHTQCSTKLAEARAIVGRVQRARAELAAEREFRREMRRIEAANRQRKKEHARTTKRERRGESDDEVRANIPPELVSLWERVKRGIRGSERMSRTEAFLHYAEENPGEVLEAVEDRTEATIRDLERQEREARRSLRRAVPREVYAAAVGSDVPF